MAVSKNVTVTCDVCGKKWTFEERERPIDVWKRSVWVSLKTDRPDPLLKLCELDVCNECLERQTMLRGDADGTIEFANVRNVAFRGDRTDIRRSDHLVEIMIDGTSEFNGEVAELRQVLRDHRKLMDAIDSVPPDGGEL